MLTILKSFKHDKRSIMELIIPNKLKKSNFIYYLQAR